MSSNYEDTLAALSTIQDRELSIIRLSEAISTAQVQDIATRNSDISSDAFENPSPASLLADLTHYRELFSKLRFSYLEQVTKEKFLRAIVGDPPLIVEHQENIELESQLLEVKAVLKAQKADVAALIEGLEARGRDLSRRYESISLQTTHLKTLSTTIALLNSTLSTLRIHQAPQSASPSLSLPLPATLSLLSSRQSQLSDLNARLKALQQALPRKTRELEKLQHELKPLEVQRTNMIASAREARRSREEDGGGEAEVQGRWLGAVEGGLREFLGMEV